MNYANLISAMSAVIKANGNNEITGDLLQQVLRAIINSLGQGYQFMGVATTATDPGTQDARLFYFAEGPGTYPNFGPLTIPDDGQVYLLVLGASWVSVQLPIPTFAGFSDLVTEVAGKMALVPAATEGNVAEFGDAGQVRDGGVQTSALARRDAGATAGNLAEFDGNGDPKDSGIAAEDVMKIPAGLMPFGPAGLAEALLDTDSEGAEQEFALRPSGGDGGAYFRRLLGNSVVFNQLIAAPTGAAVISAYITFTKNGDGSVTANGTASGTAELPLTAPSVIAGHKYALLGTNAASTFKLNTFDSTIWGGGGQSADQILTAIASGTPATFRVVVTSGATVTNETIFPMFIDLTAMFGAGNEPTTYAEFREKYPLLYYAYGRKLIHNKVAKVITKGANQWDEVAEDGGISAVSGQDSITAGYRRSKNYIPVIGGATYYIKAPVSMAILFYGQGQEYLGATSVVYGMNRTFTAPSDAGYIRFRNNDANSWPTYNHDICVNLSNADINGTYFPYWKRELDIDITNREDTNGNKPFADGAKSCPAASDEWNEVGGVVRVGTRAYQAGDESDASVITDGVDTAYALTTPVPFTWKEPLNTGIKVSKYGTEEVTPAQTENIDCAPFRAVTTYSISIANLVAALSTLGIRGGAKGPLGGSNQEENPGNGEELTPEEETPKEETDPIGEEAPTPEPVSKK